MTELRQAFGEYIRNHLGLSEADSNALRRRYWLRYGATLLGLVRHHGVSAAHFYCVGGLNTVNAIACAYAERSPVVLLTGSPGLSERVRTPYTSRLARARSTLPTVRRWW